MAASNMNVVCFVALLMILSATTEGASRDLKFADDNVYMGMPSELEAAGEGGLVECGNALLELKSCTNEIIVFFTIGQANIGTECCNAIETITRNCWPAMLTSIGVTVEQGNYLRGYCVYDIFVDVLPMYFLKFSFYN
ncbi:hypothetical protein ACFE04_017599 [Oxalis oulophora]